MKYLGSLQQKKVFKLAYAVSLTGNIETAKSMLRAYKKAGYITSIRRDLYAALDLASKHVIANQFEIGCAINKQAYISHHSALEYYGVANQIFYTVAVSSLERFLPFSYNGITYESYQPKITGGVTSSARSPLIQVTDVERTVVDCIYNLERAGGLEEFVNALRLLPQLNEDKLITYLEEYNQIFLWQKTGFILNYLRHELHLSETLFKHCKDKIHQRRKYFLQGDNTIYYPDWKLYAPQNLFNMIEQGGPLV